MNPILFLMIVVPLVFVLCMYFWPVSTLMTTGLLQIWRGSFALLQGYSQFSADFVIAFGVLLVGLGGMTRVLRVEQSAWRRAGKNATLGSKAQSQREAYPEHRRL
jgi:hypothetical protein